MTEVRVTSATGGQKGKKEACYSQIPPDPLNELARVYGYGEKKYSRANWASGYDWSLSLDAMQRHVEAFRGGQSFDPESGMHHLAHAQFHLMTLMEFERTGRGTDDRLFHVFEERQ